MKISGELQFKPNECKCEYEDNCFDCIHFICLDDNNTIECNYEDNEGGGMIDKLFEIIEKIIFIMALVGVGAYIY